MNEKPPWRVRLEPAITPAFRAWWRLTRGTTLGVRALAFDEEGRVLLIRHTYRAGWFLPGGGVESGESAPDAAARELAEEGGLEALAPPRLVGFYANHAAFKNDHVALYRFEAWRPCPPLANGEIAERGFFARDALPKGVTRGTLRRLAEAFDGIAPSAHW
ncbi:MAG: NUDIX domain-containing protein [Hyphomonadaceae bacterium]